ncbi:hypothetical protein G9A89_016452 [Geosiphon pyriformis]|nr:hypothetical protein G9A89_016452 [Geosiphon pyriformis]
MVVVKNWKSVDGPPSPIFSFVESFLVFVFHWVISFGVVFEFVGIDILFAAVVVDKLLVAAVNKLELDILVVNTLIAASLVHNKVSIGIVLDFAGNSELGTSDQGFDIDFLIVGYLNIGSNQFVCVLVYHNSGKHAFFVATVDWPEMIDVTDFGHDWSFSDCCIVVHHHIANVIHRKNLNVNWIKIKGHSGVLSNMHANVLAKDAALSAWHLPHLVSERFLKAGVDMVSGNLRHFVHNIFRSIHCAHWEIGSGSWVVSGCLHANIDCCLEVWPCVRAFSDWYHKAVSVYKDPKVAVVNIVNFVCEFCLAFHDDIWLVCAKHQVIMERNKLIPHDGSIFVAVSGFSTWLSAGVIKLLDVADALGISFGYCKHCLFYADVGNMASVHISA